jgi:hypothetical protein
LQEVEANRLPYTQFLELLFQDEINVRHQPTSTEPLAAYLDVTPVLISLGEELSRTLQFIRTLNLRQTQGFP